MDEFAKWPAKQGFLLNGRPNRNLGCGTSHSKILAISGLSGAEHVIEHLAKFANWPAK
jgi:hypothetical protein